MEKKEINEIWDVFVIGTELHVGILPYTQMVKYGYSYLNNELLLFILGTEEAIVLIEKCLMNKKVLHFNKWTDEGDFITGDGIVSLLENKEEKKIGINYIIRQENKKSFEYKDNEIEELKMYKLKVENIYK